jgi:RNA polymerase II-associated protein 2
VSLASPHQGYLIDTLSFVDALPSLRSRQWQAVVLVMLNALSVRQLPALAPVFPNPKLVQKVSNQFYFPLKIFSA